MRCLQFVAWICHFSNQGIDPIVQFQFEHTAVFGCTDVFALDQFEIVSQTGKQENVRQAGIDAAGCNNIIVWLQLFAQALQLHGEVAHQLGFLSNLHAACDFAL